MVLVDTLQRLAKAMLLLMAGISVSIASPVFGFDWLEKGMDTFRGGMKIKPRPEAPLSENELIRGLKEALRVASGRVVDQLGTVDGFLVDPQIHIPLPEKLEMARNGLSAVGYGATLDDLEVRMNRAAEAATPKTKELFWQAISDLTLERARNIYEGPEDAATRYFKEKMAPGLTEAMTPIVQDSLANVGALQLYDNVVGQYKMLPFVPDLQADLSSYVVDRGLGGIFYYLAKEEAAIRQDPVKQTTEILRRVFGQAPQ